MFAKLLNLNLIVFILLSIQLKTPHAWGFSISSDTEKRRNNYIQQVLQKELWQDWQWIRLGHYEKTIWGYKSNFRGQLFMDENGFDSPKNELFKTVNAFFTESSELTKQYGRHPQCQFLARRKWLASRIKIDPKDLLACEERIEWKAKLNTKAVSLIFAASDLGNPASSFGHTFLKMVNPENAKNKDLIDYGVNYAANADSSEGFFYAFKGLFGMYGGNFTMLPYHQKIREYINIEGRDIWEYPLHFSEQEVDFLVDHLLEMEKATAPYYFFTSNCSYHILKTLEVLREDLNLASKFTLFVIPIDTVKVLKRNSNLNSERIFKKSIKTDYLESYSQLGLLQKKALDEAVEKLVIPETYELDKKEKAEVYETAMKYMAIKSYRTGKDLDDQVYKLSSERAILGAVTEEKDTKTIQAPDLSHDSSAMYFGMGRLTDSKVNNLPELNYYSFKFKGSFHDLEQPDFGAVHMSQTEMAGFDFRYYSETKKFVLHKLTVLNLINTNPVTQLDKNISWKVRAELFDQWSPEVEGGGGMSFDFHIFQATRLAYFMTGKYFKYLDQDKLAAGPEVLLMTRPTDNIGLSLGLTYFGVLKDQSYLRIISKLNWNVKPNYDMQFEVENLFNKQIDLQLRLVKNFLF